MTHPEILALGEPLIEMVRLPTKPGGRVLYQQGVGGDTLSALVFAARQGVSVGYITALGDNLLSDDILDLCKREGVDTTHVLIHKGEPTGINVIDPDPKERRFTYARRGSAASQYAVTDLPMEAIAAARILHVSAVSLAISASMRKAVQHAAEIARKNNTLVSFDLNLRLNLWSLTDAQSCIDEFLPFTDVVLPSDDEAEVLLGTSDVDHILNYFEQFEIKHIILKRGSEGAILSSGSKRHAIPAEKVEAVDSTGAGDSLAGAFLANLLDCGDAKLATENAMKVAAQTVQRLGALG